MVLPYDWASGSAKAKGRFRGCAVSGFADSRNFTFRLTFSARSRFPWKNS
jgi:hypothetical protein